MKKKTAKKSAYRIPSETIHTPPPYTEGYWGDAMLENDSYYDIDILNKHNRPIYKKIEQWKKKYDEASSWLGKWYCQIRIDKERAKLKHYESKP